MGGAVRRLYYLTDDLNVTRAISDRLHEVGISDWNFHVLARENSGLYTHHIHSALAHHYKDIIRIGEVGALYGGASAFVLSSCGLYFSSWFWLNDWVDVLLISFVGLLVGALGGVRLGLNRENHRLKSFHDDIEAGYNLIMVDVRKEDRPRIRELMNMEFANVSYRGNDSTFVRPFKSGERIFPQSVDAHSQQKST